MSYKNKILDRIKEYYRLNGNAELAAFLEVTPQTISNWYSRKTLDFDKIITKCVGIDLNRLFNPNEDTAPETTFCTYGTVEDATIGYAADVLASYKPTARGDLHTKQQTVPLYQLHTGTSLTALLNDPEQCKPLFWLSLPGLSPCEGALYVRGDSMYPILKSGDIVLYKRITDLTNGILWGEMYLISFEIGGQEYVSVRYIRQGTDADSVCLINHNPESPAQEITLDNIRSLARVVASIRYNTMG